MSIRFSPKPITEYALPSKSAILANDEEAWNLCYLSFDWDNQPFHPDPQFSVNILRTLQFVADNGVIDLANECPDLTVRAFLRSTPHLAVKRILSMRRVSSLPMFRAYGAGWLKMIAKRAESWREPFDEQLDLEVTDFTQALQLIAKL